MSDPIRIQRQRTKGWRKPEGAVIVTRGTKWGNPFRVGDKGVPDAATAVRLFAKMLTPYTHHGPVVNGSKVADLYVSWATIAEIRAELRGKDLCCTCPLDQPCHADVLLEIANGGDE